MYRTLKLELKSAVATVTLNRPESRNAMSTQLMREMIACAGRIGAMAELTLMWAAPTTSSGGTTEAGSLPPGERPW